MRIYLADREDKHFKLGGARSVLISYYYCQNDDTVLRLKTLEHEVKIFADSGAFSAESQGASISIDSYIKWIYKNIDYLEVYSNLDVIGNQVKTRDNQRIMEEAGLLPLPVFHIGSSFAELRRICERYKYIAIGGMVPYMTKANKVRPVVKKIFEIAGDKRLHGFGCTNWSILSGFPWYSADSTTWISGRRFGEVPIFTDRLFRLRFGNWKEWRKHRRLIEDMGYDWKKLCNHSERDLEYLLKFSVATFDRVERALTEKYGDYYN
jgi:hypothetical protein